MRQMNLGVGEGECQAFGLVVSGVHDGIDNLLGDLEIAHSRDQTHRRKTSGGLC